MFLLFDQVADLEAEVKFLREEVKRLSDPNLTKETVALLTGYSETTIEAAMRDEELGFEKNGRAVRFRLSDVIAWRRNFYIQGKKKKAA